MYSVDTGITPSTSSALDWLHTLSLGVFATWCSFTVHRLLAVDAWQTYAGNQANLIPLSVSRMDIDLQRWVKAQTRSGRNITELGGLNKDTFGTPTRPKFSMKGGEANTFLEFLVADHLPGKIGCLGADGPRIQSAGNSLLHILKLLRTYKKACPTPAIQFWQQHAKHYLMQMQALRVVPKPKDHMLLEMSLRISLMGSPSLCGNWQEESLNRLPKDVAGGAHCLVHDRRILAEFPKAHDNARAGVTIAKRRRTE